MKTMIRLRNKSMVWTLAVMILTMFVHIFFAQMLYAGSMTKTLLTNRTSTGMGLRQSYLVPYKIWTCQVNVSGAPSEVVLQIMGNLTGTALNRMATWTLSTDTDYNVTAGQGMFTIVNLPAKQLAANIVTLTGGTAPAVTVICTGVE